MTQEKTTSQNSLLYWSNRQLMDPSVRFTRASEISLMSILSLSLYGNLTPLFLPMQQRIFMEEIFWKQYLPRQRELGILD